MAKQVHANIFGIIEYEPSNMWADAMGSCRLIDVKNAVEAVPDAEEVVVHINSPGGDVVEGFAIQDYLAGLKKNGKKIITAIEGRCYSIATVPLLEGDTRIMGSGSEFMIHTPWTFACGDADALQKMVEMLRKDEEKLIAFYAEKTGADQQQIRDMVKEETFMSSAQALEMKFVTEIGSAIKNKVNTTRAYAFFREEKPTDKNLITINMNAKDKTGIKTSLSAICKKFGWKDPFEAKRLNLDYTVASGDSAGKTLHIETEADAPATGDAATIDGAAAPDGTYEVDGGVMITCKDGKVDSVQQPAAAKDDTDAVKALKVQLAAETQKRIKAEADKKDDDETISAMKETLEKLAKVQSTFVPPTDKQVTNSPAKNNGIDKDKLRAGLGMKKSEPAEK